MSELKAGGLAMVFGLREFPEDNGLILTTEMPVIEEESFLNPVNGEWLTYCGPGPAWFCTGAVEPFGYGFYDKANLMPIDNADPDTLEVPTCDTDKVAL